MRIRSLHPLTGIPGELSDELCAPVVERQGCGCAAEVAPVGLLALLPGLGLLLVRRRRR